MRLSEVHIHNYKSLRSVDFALQSLSVLVGANAAGKSNLCDALDFLGEMYRWGLELAVQRHGGYENICYRQQRRSKAPIRFDIKALVSEAEMFQPYVLGSRHKGKTTELEFLHHLEFGTKFQAVEAPFYVINESLTLSRINSGDSTVSELMRIVREGETVKTINIDGLRSLRGLSKEMEHLLPEYYFERVERSLAANLADTKLMTEIMDRLLFVFKPTSHIMGAISIFELTPGRCREDAVPIPNPELDRAGINLPAVIQYVKANRAEQYQAIVSALQRVMPSLDGLEVRVTPQKTLNLQFREAGFGKPWAAMDISDGTIRATAMLAAIFDPTINVIVIEEPENSLHPWAIRQFVDACRVAVREKQVILTTHSPIVINHVDPEEVWVVTRSNDGTKIEPITAIDPEVAEHWRSGEYTLAEYLDSGIVAESVPSQPPTP